MLYSHATVFDIQRFSVHDGPGIRTTFFLKGCPLACRWCHNPEGMRAEPQLLYQDEKCILCGACATACRFGVHCIEGGSHRVRFDSCVLCGACVRCCPSQALTVSGRRLRAAEVLNIAARDRVFYGEAGGVTFSGGEAMLWPEFLHEAAGECHRAGISVAIDTCGFAPFSDFEKLLPYTDLFLYDIKAVTPAVHRAGTGRDNGIILGNYRKLLAAGARVWVRVPVIGGFNADEQEIEKIAAFLKGNPGAEEVVLMPFHFLGKNKYGGLGYPYACTDDQLVDRASMEQYMAILREHNLPQKIDAEEVTEYDKN